MQLTVEFSFAIDRLFGGRMCNLHATFDHIGRVNLKQLVAKGYVDASKMSAGNENSCVACEEANAKMEFYHSQQDLAATQVSRALHTDLLHCPVVTPDFKQLLLLVAHIYTRYTFAEVLAKKSDATDQLMRVMKRAYVHASCTSSLNVGETFQNTVVRLAKEQSGIADENVPAYCHQSIGFVEGLKYSIASITRAVFRMGRL
jgi:hypothetical protein